VGLPDTYIVLGSDIRRDGMYLELTDLQDGFLPEAFRSDVTGNVVLTVSQNPLPLNLVQRFLEIVKERLIGE